MPDPNKKILLLYDYFSPAYKAGGPIQSCTNLVRLLHNKYQFYIITSNEDLGDTETLKDIKSNCWTSFESKAKVFYSSRHLLSIKYIKTLIKEIDPDIIYINGIYSFFFSVVPLFYFRKSLRPKIIVSPRGMLQPGSLSVKPLKKILFLKVMKLIKLFHNITWHATTEQEKADIQKIFKNADVKIAGNVPNVNEFITSYREKEKESLRITTIALISPMKNILQVLQALKYINEKVVYHIYGPIKDRNYWGQCLEEMKLLPSNIEVDYKGSLVPSLVSNILRKYHFLVLPSKSENFGHVIFESFISGTPVIISDKTPWNDLLLQKAGWNVSIENMNTLKSALKSAIYLNQTDYNELCEGALTVAQTFLENSGFEDIYKELFN